MTFAYYESDVLSKKPWEGFVFLRWKFLGRGRSIFSEIGHLEGGNLHTVESNSTKYEFVVLQCQG